MKRTKTKQTQIQPNYGAFGATVSVPLAAGQVTMLMRLADALKDSNEARVAAQVFSLGLFALGLDHSGDAGLDEITDALFWEDSEDAARVFNAVTGAGDLARDTMLNAERDRRRQAYAKASTAQVSA